MIDDRHRVRYGGVIRFRRACVSECGSQRVQRSHARGTTSASGSAIRFRIAVFAVDGGIGSCRQPPTLRSIEARSEQKPNGKSFVGPRVWSAALKRTSVVKVPLAGALIALAAVIVIGGGISAGLPASMAAPASVRRREREHGAWAFFSSRRVPSSDVGDLWFVDVNRNISNGPLTNVEAVALAGSRRPDCRDDGDQIELKRLLPGEASNFEPSRETRPGTGAELRFRYEDGSAPRCATIRMRRAANCRRRPRRSRLHRLRVARRRRNDRHPFPHRFNKASTGSCSR
jgi:hypothetical protein